MEPNINNPLLISTINTINTELLNILNQGVENQGVENQGVENQGVENQGVENNLTGTTDTFNGVSEEFKNNLEEIVADEEFILKEKQCSICLEEFKLGDKYIRLPCQTEKEDEKHIFHSGNDTCSGIKPWLERNNTCPMCRTEFPKDENNINPFIETITLMIPSINNMTNVNIFSDIFNDINEYENEGVDADEGINIENIPNPNELENRISDIITNYINEIEASNEQRDIQIAIEESLQINND